jgi:hypothetical protein
MAQEHQGKHLFLSVANGGDQAVLVPHYIEDGDRLAILKHNRISTVKGLPDIRYVVPFCRLYFDEPIL